MSQTRFEQAAADFGIDLAALQTLKPQPDLPDSVEATSPTTAEFNALLAALREAGILQTA